MIIDSDDRKELCRLRLQQMRTAATSFGLLLSNGDLQGAANRLYYAVFYALSALAVSEGKSFSKHGMLIGWFNKEYVLTGSVDRSFGRFINDAWKLRSHGDYEYVTDLKVEQLQQFAPMLEAFLQKLVLMLGDKHQ
jgi:uncharacterized protein (UPF0332 family)